MAKDDDFEPRLGRMRFNVPKDRYLTGVIKGVARTAGAAKRKGAQFDGSRIGRGSGAGRILKSRDRFGAFRGRRVVIQARVIRLKASGLNAARMHLRYLQRDGVTREGLAGELYDAKSDRTEGREFLERGEGDRHQFRFIVSAEDGASYDDLKPVTRRLMEQMEKDLGTRLDWVAVDHWNTGHPHTHVVVRGKDDRGEDLVIAREYIAHGMRERAAEIVSLDLGPRTDREIENRLRQEIDQERLTSIDRELLRERDADGLVHGVGRDAFRTAVRAGRLQKLERLGLAEETAPGTWHLDGGMERALQNLGERGDIIKTIHREMKGKGLERSFESYAVQGDDAGPVIGRVVSRGLADELKDRYYLIIDGVDGRAHYVGIGEADRDEPIREGTVVAIRPRGTGVRRADRVIAEIAGDHEGVYSPDLHRDHDPRARAGYIEAFVRRLEDLRRAGVVERHADGSWAIPPDYLKRVEDLEARRSRTAPVIIETMARAPLNQQARVMAATWLDRELIGDSQLPVRDMGFGREVAAALQHRRQWLIEQGLAQEEQGQTVYRARLLAELRRRELSRTGTALAGELGVPYAETKPGERIDGIYRRHIDLESGRFAVIEKSREFTLVPWRPVLQRAVNKPVSGIMRDETISWTLGRQRGGPSIS
jgi:type IV secretory pathway VirD2 relaxase